MSDSPMPPRGGDAPPIKCGRLLEWPDQASRCPNDAAWHVIWTSAIENGLCCDAHKAEADHRWVYYAVHRYEMACSMPGAVYVEADNRCVVDEGFLGFTEEQTDVIARTGA